MAPERFPDVGSSVNDHLLPLCYSQTNEADTLLSIQSKFITSVLLFNVSLDIFFIVNSDNYLYRSVRLSVILRFSYQFVQ